MAALDVVPIDAPGVAGEVLLIPVHQIEVKDRLRPVDPAVAQGLAALIGEHGQDDAISVCRLPGQTRWRLVSGAHRLEACRLLNQPVKAVVTSADALDRRRREISENLFHSGLDPIARAAFVAELYDVVRAKAGMTDASAQQVAISARWQNEAKKQSTDTSANIARVYGFADEVAEAFGLSRRSIYNDLTLHKGLLPDVAAKLRHLPAAQLRALAKLPPEDQRRALQLIETGKAKRVGDAVAILSGAKVKTAEDKAWNAFFGGWGRMNAEQRLLALRELNEQGLPKGARLVFDGGA
ncbi:MAG: ParB/RepB/Spo0J family partition protein [Caulobacteraceae bacterium]